MYNRNDLKAACLTFINSGDDSETVESAKDNAAEKMCDLFEAFKEMIEIEVTIPAGEVSGTNCVNGSPLAVSVAVKIDGVMK